MTDGEFVGIGFRERKYMQSVSPYRTGRLRRNIKSETDQSTYYRIYIDTKKVPYQKYLENGTPLSTKHKGWFKRTAEIIARDVAMQAGGELATDITIGE